MKAQSSTSMNLELDADLRRPERLAYHRLHGSGDLVREIHDLKATPMGQAESIETLYQWLFVPISIWPIDIDGPLRQLIKALRSKTRLQKSSRYYQTYYHLYRTTKPVQRRRSMSIQYSTAAMKR